MRNDLYNYALKKFRDAWFQNEPTENVKYWAGFMAGVKAASCDRCVCCGAEIPEGVRFAPTAKGAKTMGKTHDKPVDNLARNALLATQAGMSYGKWKAMQPVAEPKLKELPEGWRLCRCGKAFTGRANKKYCCPECQHKHYNIKRRKTNIFYG